MVGPLPSICNALGFSLSIAHVNRALGRKQDHKFKATLSYIENRELSWATWDPVRRGGRKGGKEGERIVNSHLLEL